MPTNRIRKAVIPAAGRGTRLLPITRSFPKEMLPVGRMPVIHHVVNELIEAGLEQILLIVSQRKGSILEYFDQERDLPCRIYYITQPEPKGLADAVSLAQDFTGDEEFVVALGDSVIDSPGSGVTKRLVDLHCAQNAGATLAVVPVPKHEVPRYGIVQPEGTVDDEFKMAALVEKPPISEAPSNLAIAARYCFRPDIFDFIRETRPGKNNELQLTDSIQLLLDSGAPGWCLRMKQDEIRYDIGNHESYRDVVLAFARADVRRTTT